MHGYGNRHSLGKYPLKQIQFERAFELVAKLCKKYDIPINKNTVFTHYEFGLANPQTTSRGKIDITIIPYLPTIEPYKVGDFIRQKCLWYKTKL